MTEPAQPHPQPRMVVTQIKDNSKVTVDPLASTPSVPDTTSEQPVGLPEVPWRGAQEWICGFVVHWPDAPGWYQIDWGDGSTEISHRDLPARRHSYTDHSACDNLGYTVTVRELYRDGTTGPVAASAAVQARGRGNPAHRFTLAADGRTVRAELGPYEPPRGFTVEWDDDSPLDHRPDGERYCEHTYPAGESFQPLIGLLDRPARRVRWFFGPTVNPKKELKKTMTFQATYTPSSQWYGGYSASYRITNQGKDASTWELSFLLDEPARVEDVWGAGEQKRSENKKFKGGKPGTSTEPAFYMQREDLPTGRGAAYVFKCKEPLKPGQSVDVGFRVESGEQQTAEPRNCSINGGPCTGSKPPEEDTEPPTPPTDLKVTNTGPKAVSLSWGESTDDTGVKAYEVFVDGDLNNTVPAPAKSGSAKNLDPETTYEVKVRAVDLAGNKSLFSNTVQATTDKDTPQVEKAWLAKLAPFTDMGLWPTPQLATFAGESELKAFNLGFVTAVSASECKAVWAGQRTYAVEDGWQKDNIATFTAVKDQYAVVSFGGESGVELAQAATDADEAYDQYRLVVTTYGLDKNGPQHVDFDIEGAAQKDQPANERRAAAVARLQKEFPDLRVSWTLPVLPEGLTADGLNVLRTAVNAGVRLDLVNIMAMVFYRNEDMGQLVRQAMESTHAQLAEFFPNLTARRRWSKLSVCPMVGQNNDGAIYSLAHAEETTQFALEKHLGQITYWEAGRDRNACLSESLYMCTNIPQQKWDFARRFKPFQDAPAPAPVPEQRKPTAGGEAGKHRA